jgi:hypothetical protein
VRDSVFFCIVKIRCGPSEGEMESRRGSVLRLDFYLCTVSRTII